MKHAMTNIQNSSRTVMRMGRTLTRAMEALMRNRGLTSGCFVRRLAVNLPLIRVLEGFFYIKSQAKSLNRIGPKYQQQTILDPVSISPSRTKNPIRTYLLRFFLPQKQPHNYPLNCLSLKLLSLLFRDIAIHPVKTSTCYASKTNGRYKKRGQVTWNVDNGGHWLNVTVGDE